MDALWEGNSKWLKVVTAHETFERKQCVLTFTLFQGMLERHYNLILPVLVQLECWRRSRPRTFFAFSFWWLFKCRGENKTAIQFLCIGIFIMINVRHRTKAGERHNQCSLSYHCCATKSDALFQAPLFCCCFLDSAFATVANATKKEVRLTRVRGAALPPCLSCCATGRKLPANLERRHRLTSMLSK